MKIGIIGAGQLGSTLGGGWSSLGHSIMFGVRDTESARTRDMAERAAAALGTLRQANAFGEATALCVPWSAVDDALAEAGDLSGKTLLDCTNPLTPGLELAPVPGHDSGAAYIESRAPGARVVKAFNTTGVTNIASSKYPDGRPMMPYCGDHESAKETARSLAEDLGFEPIDAGGLNAAALLESTAALWVRLAYGQGLGTEIALRLMKR